MELKDAIYKRRSIRKFKDTPVDKDLTEELLKAAMAAPSACNFQPWYFIVVTNSDVIGKLDGVSPYSKMNAPLNIIVCGKTEDASKPGWWIEDVSAATENMLLRATDLGLGACWCGLYPRMERSNKVKEILHLEENLTPFASIKIGYPDETKEPGTKYTASNIRYIE